MKSGKVQEPTVRNSSDLIMGELGEGFAYGESGGEVEFGLEFGDGESAGVGEDGEGVAGEEGFFLGAEEVAFFFQERGGEAGDGVWEGFPFDGDFDLVKEALDEGTEGEGFAV